MHPRQPKPGRSLAVRFPAVAAQWHPTRNGTLTPDQVTAFTPAKAWFLCPEPTCGYEWETFISSRAQGRGCQACNGQVVTALNCLTATHPHLAAQWHPTRNGDQTPHTVKTRTPGKFWWRCDQPDCDHQWQRTIQNRVTKATGCPLCQKKSCHPHGREGGSHTPRANRLIDIHPHIAADWHPTKNPDRTLDTITSSSTYNATWSCQTCAHTWQQTVFARTDHGPRTCPNCRYLTQLRNGTTLAEHSSQLAAQWHPTRNGTKTPQDFTFGSQHVATWLCPTCNHVWKRKITARTSAGRACPACAGYTITKTNCLNTTHPAIAAQWHPTKNAPLTPNDITPGTNQRVWWYRPQCGHTWQAVTKSQVRSGGRCPKCPGGHQHRPPEGQRAR